MLRAWTRPAAKCATLAKNHKLVRPSIRRKRLIPSLLRNPYATVASTEVTPNPGDSIHGFTVQATKHVPELHLTAIRLQHDSTGADYLHVARDDSNNVFSIGFKTNPPDDTGVPHILEHTTLCGSKKFPVRDPFFRMLPRSLSTFMNAFTSSDHTTYPFSTTNSQDFKNLMSVYLDATLFPLLKKDDFRQEGWRLGLQEGLDTQAESKNDLLPVIFKGVVYNEMKGMMSDAGYVFHVRWNDHIFPAIHNSGGDPQKITDLTHEDLVSFHVQNYHPSNAKIFTYGNMPLREHLNQVGGVLSQFEKRNNDLNLKLPLDLQDGPYSVKVNGPIETTADPLRQHKTSVTWLTGDTANIEERFALAVISSLLTDGYGSPMHKALIESELGSHFTPNTGFDTSANIGSFTIGVGGVAPENVLKVKDAITIVFENLVFQGVNDEKVEGILHQLELSLKHKSASFGLGMVQKVSSGWFNGVDPTKLVVWNDVVSRFKNNYQEEGYLEGLVIKHFLNDRYLSFTMEPSPDFDRELRSEESLRLQRKFAEASEAAGSPEKAVEAIRQQDSDLTQVQECGRTQDLSCLPSLKVEDISRQTERRTVELSNLGDVSVQWRKTSTNGLTYFKALHNFDALPHSHLLFLPLFFSCINRLGTREQTMEELEDILKLKTGGISFSRHSATSPSNLNMWSEGLLCSGLALDRNIPTLLNLTQKLITKTDFFKDDSRAMIKELLKTHLSGIVDSIGNSGHAFARDRAASFLRPKLAQDEGYGGLNQMAWLLNAYPLNGDIPDELLQWTIKVLAEIQTLAIANSSSLRVSVTCEPGSVPANEASLKEFLSGLPSTPDTSSRERFPLRNAEQQDTGSTGQMEFFQLPYQVSYSGIAVPTVPMTDPATAPLAILGELLTHRHLHHEIREKGGAYGGGAGLSMHDGFFYTSSYRDPNPANSIQVSLNAGRWATEQSWTDRDLTEAKLSIFQKMDAPKDVDREGDRLFLRGISDELTQELRERLLDVNASDVKKVANNYLVEEIGKANMCVIGPRQDWVKPEDGWQTRTLLPEESPKKSIGIWDAIATGAILSWLF